MKERTKRNDYVCMISDKMMLSVSISSIRMHSDCRRTVERKEGRIKREREG